ncbi:hypothetical protein [Inquilinus sp. CA228]|uniref:hypothetical protein n=1 Tax=Inquilinus sp. CA228 TaxID=3455609 RepID=UPI003F8D4E27
MPASNSLVIESPKLTPQAQRGWNGFFPYYAGYPESFARALLKSAHLPVDSMVLDPWNGSGTTTYSAYQLGIKSCGFDLNPVMVIIARARLLPPSEADALEPLARKIIDGIRADSRFLELDDPLLWWFDRPAAALIRALERRIRDQLVGELTLTREGVRFDKMASMAAAFYVALFSVCRQMATPYRSSNPTWLRKPKDEQRISTDRQALLATFAISLKNMAESLSSRTSDSRIDYAAAKLFLADATSTKLDEGSVDLVLTSPPYCTRIDYSAATRIELAVLHPLTNVATEDLSRRMLGSTRVPRHNIAANEAWGEKCSAFLSKIKTHPSKASSGYYYKTHIDYFDKMAKSLSNISISLKFGGQAVLVVQDSYYKDIHNDLPSIVAEMAKAANLNLTRREDFHFRRSMAGVNRHSRAYGRPSGVVESVLCFEKPLP